MTPIKYLLLAFLTSASLCVQAQSQSASGYPSKTIRIVVPFTAGSGSDTSARFAADQFARELQTTVVVENKPGASGLLAVQTVRSAPADGHTILLASNSLLSVNPLVIKAMPYDPVKDIRPIGGRSRGMNVLITSPDSNIRTLEDAVRVSKTKPDGLTLGTYSAGYHLTSLWLGNTTGLQFINVPYKGGAPTMADVAGGILDLALVDSSGALGLIQSGKLIPIVVTGETRHPLIDAPTVRESGYEDFVQYSWTSFYVDAKTPEPIVAKLDAVLKVINASAEARAFAQTTGGEVLALDAQAMRRYQDAEIERFKRIADQAGIRPG